MSLIDTSDTIDTSMTKNWPNAKVPSGSIYIGSYAPRGSKPDVYIDGDEVFVVTAEGRKLIWQHRIDAGYFPTVAGLIQQHNANAPR